MSRLIARHGNREAGNVERAGYTARVVGPCVGWHACGRGEHKSREAQLVCASFRANQDGSDLDGPRPDGRLVGGEG